jgi:hypothetical protein
MVADLSPPMSVENIHLNLKQKINTKGIRIRGCSLLPDSRMALSCYSTNDVSFINKEGVELFQIGKDKTGSRTYDTVYIKDNNSVAVSSGEDGNRCITMIDIASKKVMTTISMDTEQDNAILLSGSKEHPLIRIPFVFIFCFRFRCIFSTDIGGDRSATIIWACLFFFLKKVSQEGFDSITTAPKF